jgi:hypothetical protein
MVIITYDVDERGDEGLVYLVGVKKDRPQSDRIGKVKADVWEGTTIGTIYADFFGRDTDRVFSVLGRQTHELCVLMAHAALVELLLQGYSIDEIDMDISPKSLKGAGRID